MSFLTSRRISSSVSAILFNCVVSMFPPISFYMHPTLSRKHCQARSLKLAAFGRSHPKLFLTLSRIASKTNGPLIPGPSHHRGLFLTSNGPGIRPDLWLEFQSSPALTLPTFAGVGPVRIYSFVSAINPQMRLRLHLILSHIISQALN